MRDHVGAVHVVHVAVAVVVHAVAGNLLRVGPDVGRQVGVRDVHAGVDHGDHDVPVAAGRQPVALQPGPRFRHLRRGQVPLLRAQRVRAAAAARWTRLLRHEVRATQPASFELVTGESAHRPADSPVLRRAGSCLQARHGGVYVGAVLHRARYTQLRSGFGADPPPESAWTVSAGDGVVAAGETQTSHRPDMAVARRALSARLAGGPAACRPVLRRPS